MKHSTLKHLQYLISVNLNQTYVDINTSAISYELRGWNSPYASHRVVNVSIGDKSIPASCVLFDALGGDVLLVDTRRTIVDEDEPAREALVRSYVPRGWRGEVRHENLPFVMLEKLVRRTSFINAFRFPDDAVLVSFFERATVKFVDVWSKTRDQFVSVPVFDDVDADDNPAFVIGNLREMYNPLYRTDESIATFASIAAVKAAANAQQIAMEIRNIIDNAEVDDNTRQAMSNDIVTATPVSMFEYTDEHIEAAKAIREKYQSARSLTLEMDAEPSDFAGAIEVLRAGLAEF